MRRPEPAGVERVVRPAAPAVFLDRDGTLIEDRGHLRRPAEVVFFPQTVAALQRLQERFLLFIVTNQRGVADGVLTEEHVRRVNAHVLAELAREGVRIVEVYSCLHSREQGCQCIKPEPYFIHLAAQRYGVCPERSFSVGDHPHDAHMAERAGGRGVFVLTGHGPKHRSELPAHIPVVSDIGQAASHILAQAR